MATQYKPCPGCGTQNIGINVRCTNCGSMLPVSPMPMQHMPAPSFGARPGQLQAISIIQTAVGGLEVIGGLIGLIYVLFVALLTLGIGLIFLPIPLIFLVIGIFSLISGIKGLQGNYRKSMSYGVAISQMVLLLLCDVLSFGGGLATVILLSQPEVKMHFLQNPD